MQWLSSSGASGDLSRAMLGGRMVYLRMISDVQHDPDTVDNLVAAIRIEQATHIPVLARQAKFPLVELAIKLTIFLLPLFDVGESANIDLEYAVS